MKSFNYYQPTRLLFGAGRRAETGAAVREIADTVLFVVDPTLLKVAAARVAEVEESLAAAGVRYVRFSDVVPNPTLDTIQRGASHRRSYCSKPTIFARGSSFELVKE